MNDEPSYEELKELVAALRRLSEQQGARIAELEDEIARLADRLGRTPRNSSMPPSAEGLSKPPANRAERRKAAKRRPGKQPGSEGHHLARVEHPDAVVLHAPRTCRGCGQDLAGADIVSVEARQVFEMPAVRAHVTEHRLVKLRCSCGCETKGTAPPEASAPAAYGPRVRALAVYLSIYHHVPYARLAEIFTDVMGVRVSAGSLAAMVAEGGAGLGGFEAELSQRLRAAPVVHFDETGARVAGFLHWVHVASNTLDTLLRCHTRRGGVALDDIGVIGAMDGVAVHDGWTPYRAYDVVHGLCNAHHLRELEAVTERFAQAWAAKMITLLTEAKTAVAEAQASGRTHLEADVLDSIQRRYDRLVKAGRAANAGPAPAGIAKTYANTPINLLERLDYRRDQVLRFCVDFDVPFDNNQAERDIRMVKLQQKISGSWRTEAGAERFCALRSYVSTMKKHGYDVLLGLHDLFEGHAWLPGGT